jgi:uncharacterized coiled-coil protein SlyX
MPYIAQDKCVYKKTKDGKKGAKVGCTKGDVKKYLGALYSADKKSAKNELSEIIAAFEVGKKHEELMMQLESMHANVKGMYEGMNGEVYEASLSEIEKMHNEMRQLYNEISKLK